MKIGTDGAQLAANHDESEQIALWRRGRWAKIGCMIVQYVKTSCSKLVGGRFLPLVCMPVADSSSTRFFSGSSKRD